MKNYHFFAMISRMKYIDRWSLMRNSRSENLSEHSMEAAVVAHALVLLHNRRFGGELNAERAALLGLYHDAPESLVHTQDELSAFGMPLTGEWQIVAEALPVHDDE